MPIKSTAIDLVSGSLGGIAGTVIGHPFDTVKVRIQTSNSSQRSALDIFRSIMKNEGFRGLYRGVLPPVYSMAAVNAYLFAVEGAISRKLDLESFGSTGCFVSGFLAGAAQCIIITPVELVKTQLQVQTKTLDVSEMKYARSIFNKHGIGGIYRGLSATICRDAPACGIYFAGNNFFLQQLSYSNRDSSLTQLYKLMVAGGIAGVLSWIISFPLDVIKSRMQADNLNVLKYSGMVDCYSQTTRDGRRILLRGINPALLRAFPSNGALFTVHHITLQFLTQLNT